MNQDLSGGGKPKSSFSVDVVSEECFDNFYHSFFDLVILVPGIYLKEITEQVPTDTGTRISNI